MEPTRSAHRATPRLHDDETQDENRDAGGHEKRIAFRERDERCADDAADDRREGVAERSLLLRLIREAPACPLAVREPRLIGHDSL